MADLAAAVAASVRPVRVIDKHTGPSGAVVTPGQWCVYDATTGLIVPGDASAANTSRNGGVAIEGAPVAGQTVTIVTQGDIDMGEMLVGLTFNAPVYASDTTGRLADAAGTAGGQIGYVKPAYGNATSTDRLLHVGPG